MTVAWVSTWKSPMCQGGMLQWKAMSPHVHSAQGKQYANRLSPSIWLQAPREDVVSYYSISSWHPRPFPLGLGRYFQGERGRITLEVTLDLIKWCFKCLSSKSWRKGRGKYAVILASSTAGNHNWSNSHHQRQMKGIWERKPRICYKWWD